MPIDKKLLEILCCPATKVPVRPLDPERLASLNDAIAAGRIKNRAGEQLSERLEEALITEDDKTVYEVRGGIPIMLIEKGIPPA